MWQDLGPTGGVALVPKDALPKVLTIVGYTSRPTAALLTQSPDEVGLRSYPRSRVLCNIDVDAGAGEPKVVMVERYLVQQGFGVPVGMRNVGPEVEVGITMVKMVAKMSTGRGWVAGPHPAGV